MALILTLAILALMSILLVSFVSMALRDRGATQSYAKSLQADQVALGGLNVIVSQIQAEIADPALNLTNSYSVAGSVTNNLYIPLASTNSVPQRMTPASMATLIATSGTSLYMTNGVGITNYSSSSSTLNSSLNGRLISTARWNKPQLMTNTASFPTPQWVLVTRSGPQQFTTYSGGSGGMADDSPLNLKFVTGRYAYTVYDTSGLLDANVAGYPSGAAASATGKGLMPWADLRYLTNSSAVPISQADIDNLVNWRNASTASPAANYVTNVYAAATNNGFTRVANGDTTFLSRQELIKYATTQNMDLTNALPYLTTFSRELNGPTWGPTTNSPSINYTNQEYTVGSFNPRIPNPRVQAFSTQWYRNNGLPAVVGEPLVKYRFPLDKLALLEKFAGAAPGTLSTTDITNIRKYFGLDLAADANGPSFRHWNYPTTNAAYKHSVLSGANGIMSLDDVAALPNNGYAGREPDFFELLQAGILSGSLGVPGATVTSGVTYPNSGRSDKYPNVGGNGPQPPNYVDPDDSATLQTLRIGANIIDQWGAENFPSTITYTLYTAAGAQITYYNVEGIKDLPYPFAACMNMFSLTSGTTGTTGSYTTPLAPWYFYLYFELWNPHRTPSSPVAANYPTQFRFSPYYDNSLPANSDSFLAGFDNSRLSPSPYSKGSWFYNGTPTTKNGPANGHTTYYMANIATNSAGTYTGIPFTYSPTASTNDYRQPTLAAGAPVGAPLATVQTVFPAMTNIACLAMPPLTSFPNTGEPANQGSSLPFPPTSGPGSPDGAWFARTYFKMVMPIQYKDAVGNWHTYSTFIGMDDPAGAYVGETCYDNYGGASGGNVTITPALSYPSLAKSDPRDFRFGVCNASGPNVNVPLATSSGLVPATMTSGPFGSGITPYRLDLWAQNDSANACGYNDVDGVRRWGDAHNSYTLSPATSPLFTGNPPGATPANTPNLPVILNRPFQSVGEMGYAFRDMPWKTLDLFSSKSADSALLDLFTLNDSPILAGRVNPNTPYPQVLAALISGATQSTANSTTVSSPNALAIGQAIQSTTAVSPFVTRADLVNNFMTNSAISNMSTIKTEEEAAVRAVAESANTRTWTFLIDIIAQSGRYPATAGSLDNFVVEGERRYWLHVSIDRYTGQVVDKQLEVVNE